MITALTIAGTDSAGGAGIQADLRAFQALGVHGLCAITAVTAQDVEHVRQVHALPPELVAAQIDAVASSPGVKVAKTGMLPTPAIVEVVERKARQHGLALVVDPVLLAGSGEELASKQAFEALRQRLLPLAKVVTPNALEAEALTGMRVRSVAELAKAAEALLAMGAECVLLKGGHVAGDPIVDVLASPDGLRELRHPRLGGSFHGTGCTLSAMIAAKMALGAAPSRACEEGVDLLQRSMAGARTVGARQVPDPARGIGGLL